MSHTPLADKNGLSVSEIAKLLQVKVSVSQSLSAKEQELLVEIVKVTDESVAQYMLFSFQINITDNPEKLLDIIYLVRLENCINIMTVISHPFSRCRVHIPSTDINVKPMGDPNYMSHELDLELFVRNVQFMKRIRDVDGAFQVGLKTCGSSASKHCGG